MNANLLKLIESAKDSKKVLIFDWLTLTVDDFLNHDECTKQLDFDGVILTQLEGKRTSHFNKIFEIHLNGFRVATLTAQSASKHILVNRAQIKFENELFYTGQLKNVLNRLKTALHLQNIQISRLDIAIDGATIHPFVNHFYYEATNKDFVRVNDSDNITPIGFSRDDMRNRCFDSFVVGSFGSKRLGKSKSDRFIRYYNKTREIAEVSHKDYITEFHKKNDLEAGNVYRFEISLTSGFLKDRNVTNVDLLFNQDYLIKLFSTALKNFFEFRTLKGKNISRGELINLFGDFQTVDFIEKIKKVIINGVRTVKAGVKRLLESCVIGVFSSSQHINERKSLEDSIFDIIRVYQLEDWFSRVAPYMWEAFQQTARKENIKLCNTQFKLFN